jgi:MarR family transcriptional regulator for hemolysin
MPAPPLLPPIGLRLARTARDVGAAFEAELAAAGGSAATWQVLLLLHAERWGTQRQLAEAIGIRGATLTHHLNRMERDGLVERHRDPDNRRVQVVGLTTAGERLFARLRTVALAFDERLCAALGGEELSQLAAGLEHLRAAVEPPEAARAGGGS